MPKACFWGANLNSTNMSEGNYAGADFRTANFLNTCLADSDLSSAKLDGAYFSRTIVTGADISNVSLSCPSVFTLDLANVKNLCGAIYSHLGEVECDLSHAPLIIQGLQKPLIFMNDAALIGSQLIKSAVKDQLLETILSYISQEKIFEQQVLRA